MYSGQTVDLGTVTWFQLHIWYRPQESIMARRGPRGSGVSKHKGAPLQVPLSCWARTSEQDGSTVDSARLQWTRNNNASVKGVTPSVLLALSALTGLAAHPSSQSRFACELFAGHKSAVGAPDGIAQLVKEAKRASTEHCTGEHFKSLLQALNDVTTFSGLGFENAQQDTPVSS